MKFPQTIDKELEGQIYVDIVCIDQVLRFSAGWVYRLNKDGVSKIKRTHWIKRYPLENEANNDS